MIQYVSVVDAVTDWHEHTHAHIHKCKNVERSREVAHPVLLEDAEQLQTMKY